MKQITVPFLYIHSQHFMCTWNSRSRGFIMEGFPQSGDELRYMCSRGLYPDAAAILQVEEHNIVSRLLPGKMEIWRKKRNRKLQKQMEAKEERLREWVGQKSVKVMTSDWI